MSTLPHRFKEYQSGAAHPLRDSDLLIATLNPVSRQVHTAKLLVYPSGHFEFAEWITAGRSGSSIFHKESGCLDTTVLHQLKAALLELPGTVPELSRAENVRPDHDPSIYEGCDRRTLAYHHAGASQWCALPDESFYSDFQISPDQRARFTQCFDSIWEHILSALASPCFRPEHPGPRWTFPVVGIYDSNDKTKAT